MLKKCRLQISRLLGVALIFLAVASVAWASGASPSGRTDLTLKGGQDGTVFRSLTVEGENRVQIRFERPELSFDIDPEQAPGLMLDDALDILDRTLPDLAAPFMKTSVHTASDKTPHPWLDAYSVGEVARFTAAMESVASWKLQVVDSRGETAMVFVGQGNPPTEIPWDGVRLDGTAAAPGYTYSFVLEARDEAGNQRRFVGEGFPLPAYRRETAGGPELMVSGQQWLDDRDRQNGPSALALAAASWFNLRSPANDPVRITVTHRTVVEAAQLAELVADNMRPLLGGDPARIATELKVEPGSPPAGTLHLTSARENDRGQTGL